jgi:hypothetical protein
MNFSQMKWKDFVDLIRHTVCSLGYGTMLGQIQHAYDCSRADDPIVKVFVHVGDCERQFAVMPREFDDHPLSYFADTLKRRLELAILGVKEKEEEKKLSMPSSYEPKVMRRAGIKYAGYDVWLECPDDHTVELFEKYLARHFKKELLGCNL